MTCSNTCEFMPSEHDGYSMFAADHRGKSIREYINGTTIVNIMCNLIFDRLIFIYYIKLRILKVCTLGN